mmetsp:Transcript_1398/g.930  ORF Transcript_1398/g.930 Transcript_1398/m.930 type:complete len:89 (+) Transcript_1398:676-942(+)
MKTNCSPAWMARMGAGLSGSFASLSDTRGCSTSLSKSEVSFVIVLVADIPRSPNKRCGWTEHNLNPGFPGGELSDGADEGLRSGAGFC